MTREDYDEQYLRKSEVLDSIAGLLINHRIVVLGFGFGDLEVTRLIRQVGHKTSPDRPIFAFLGGLDGDEHQDERDEFRDYSNIEVIPYRINGESHRELRRLVDIYGSLIVRRSLKLNQPIRRSPSWDAETTALLTYNELVLRHPPNVEGSVLQRLLRSQIVSRLSFNPGLTSKQLTDELGERVRLLATEQQIPSNEFNSFDGDAAVAAAISTLLSDDLVQEKDESFALTAKGSQLVATQHSKAQFLRDQFLASLRDRVMSLEDVPESVERITIVLSEYLEECMCSRGLGVALAWKGATPTSRKVHMTALLQHLPSFLEQRTSTDEIEVVILVIQELLAAPSNSEQVYLGMRMQAEFSVQLLAFSPELVETRMRQMEETAFVLDSSVLIPFFAEGCVGHEAAVRLVRDLRSLKSLVASSDDLVQELRDHAGWATRFINREGPRSTEVIAASTGRSGYRQNLFIAGFLTQAANLGGTMNFDSYLDRQFGSRGAHTGRLEVFVEACEEKGVVVKSFSEWDGFEPSHWSDRQDAQLKIEELRKRNESYKGELQVKAEAGARMLVELLRAGTIGVGGQSLAKHFSYQILALLTSILNTANELL